MIQIINIQSKIFFIYSIDIEDNYILNKENPEVSIFNYNLEDDFKKDSILQINSQLLYDYNNYNNIGSLLHIFKLYDENNILIHEQKNLKTNSGDNNEEKINQIDSFYYKLNNNYSIIKIELILSIIDNLSSTRNISCKLSNLLSSNFLCIKYYKKINLISVSNNLGDLENNILTNKNNISNISSEIDYIKNNISNPYLKNIYNISFYDEKTQVNLREIFYEKIFIINSKKDDFIEINLKMLLEYEDISERLYVSTIYKILDKDDNSLYISQINNNDYQFFSNKLSIKENIFYNFTNNIDQIKFRISFVITAFREIKIWYTNDNNYRFILKHYST